MQNSPIGIFDSGLGGLTVMAAIRKLLPNENLIYVGDTARVPYGTKSRETVQRYAREIADFLLNQKVKALVIACNTASAHALAILQEHCPVPVLGVLLPGAKAAVAATRNQRVAVIGTEGTMRSGAYAQAIKNLNPAIEVMQQACPLFVPLVEEGWTANDVTRLTIQQYLSGLKEHQIDTVILGCTHYPLLKSALGDFFGKGVNLVDSAEQTALELQQLLTQNNLCREANDAASTLCYATDAPEKFKQMADKFLHNHVNDVRLLELAH